MKEKLIGGHPHTLLEHEKLSSQAVTKKSIEFYELMNKRRSVRQFSTQDVPIEALEQIIKTASSAPSGAHKQPWTFCVVSDPSLKKEIREAAEKEEYESYKSRMTQEWIEDLKPIGTDWQKPFLENAPYLIVAFKKIYNDGEDGKKESNYYVNESVGIACGFLISAIHNAGLATLTHTPNPMNFLSKLLERPKNERPYLLLPVGFPAEETYVPKLYRKPLEEVAVFYR